MTRISKLFGKTSSLGREQNLNARIITAVNQVKGEHYNRTSEYGASLTCNMLRYAFSGRKNSVKSQKTTKLTTVFYSQAHELHISGGSLRLRR